jgi:hypothetical protein
LIFKVNFLDPLNVGIERLSDKATSNSLSLWERAGVRGD